MKKGPARVVSVAAILHQARVARGRGAIGGREQHVAVGARVERRLLHRQHARAHVLGEHAVPILAVARGHQDRVAEVAELPLLVGERRIGNGLAAPECQPLAVGRQERVIEIVRARPAEVAGGCGAGGGGERKNDEKRQSSESAWRIAGFSRAGLQRAWRATAAAAVRAASGIRVVAGSVARRVLALDLHDRQDQDRSGLRSMCRIQRTTHPLGGKPQDRPHFSPSSGLVAPLVRFRQG